VVDVDAPVPFDRMTGGQLLATLTSPGLSHERQDELVNHPSVSSRDLLDFLGGDIDCRDTVLALTENPDVLELWSGTEDVYLRAVIAFNPSTPAHVLATLADDVEPIVRANAALNGALSAAIRIRLWRHDPSEDVRDQAGWAMTTVQGQHVLDGHRYARLSDSDLPDDDNIFRVLAYGISATLPSPR
jgi:hypothetical protein